MVDVSGIFGLARQQTAAKELERQIQQQRAQGIQQAFKGFAAQAERDQARTDQQTQQENARTDQLARDKAAQARFDTGQQNAQFRFDVNRTDRQSAIDAETARRQAGQRGTQFLLGGGDPGRLPQGATVTPGAEQTFLQGRQAQQGRDDRQAAALAEDQARKERLEIELAARAREGSANRASNELQTDIRQRGLSDRRTVPVTPEDKTKMALEIARGKAEIDKEFDTASAKVGGAVKSRIEQLKAEAKKLFDSSVGPGGTIDNPKTAALSRGIRRRMEVILSQHAKDPEGVQQLIAEGWQIDPATDKWFNPAERR